MVRLCWEGTQEHDALISHHQYLAHSEAATIGVKAPWTTARCNRLLRPISSKIAALRKARQSKPEQVETSRVTCQCNGYTSIPAGVASYQAKSAEPASSTSNNWTLSPRPRKKVRRTYSSRIRSQGSESAGQHEDQDQVCPPRDAGIGLPPDFATSPRPEYHPMATTQKAQTLQNNGQGAITEVSRCIVSDEGRLIDGLCTGLVALLRVTSRDESNLANSCRSLFSTCLRHVPKYIKQEETLSKADDPTNDEDVSSTVYNDLEEFASVPGAGWQPLREVVRAHGINMIRDAIQEGVIGFTDGRHISSLCLAVAAPDEAQCILESMTNLGMSVENRPLRQNTVPAAEAQALYYTMEKFTSQTGRYGFLYRQTATMLESCMLPLEWISSKAMISCWNGVIRSITHHDEHVRSATLLLHATLFKWYCKAGKMPLSQVHDIRLRARKEFQRPTLRSTVSRQTIKAIDTLSTPSRPRDSLPDDTTDGLYLTLSNILTVFSAITFLNTSVSAVSMDCSNDSSMRTLNDLGVEVRQALELASFDADSPQASTLLLERLRLPLLAAGMSRRPSTGSNSQHRLYEGPELTCLAGLQNSAAYYGSAGSFIGAVARCSARAKFVNAFNFIKRLVDDFLSLSTSHVYDARTKSLCGNIALAAAFEFSENTSQPDHLNWALDVELALNGAIDGPSKPAFEKTPARGTTQNKNGYRWEEGICEWIANTPALVIQSLGDVNANDSEDEEPAETPTAGIKQPLPLLSESTPCATNKKAARAEGRPYHGRSKASLACIKIVNGACGNGNAIDEQLPSKAYQGSGARKASSTRPFRKIYLDEDDLDELSMPDSSQEQVSAVSTLQGAQNASFHAKRKMQTNASQAANASKRPRMFHRPKCTIQPATEIHTSDMEDELSLS